MHGPEDEATKQGNLLRDKGDFDGAIAAFTEAIRLDPKNALPYYGRGRASRKKENWVRPSLTAPRPFGSIHNLPRHIGAEVMFTM